mmetsp:Transcript_30223/g.86727  ORF Transcript_30223/g.86727 Transcript_30223/m.86727 type:complete len:235 (+) Transcript_30223:673-1377(+)
MVAGCADQPRREHCCIPWLQGCGDRPRVLAGIFRHRRVPQRHVRHAGHDVLRRRRRSAQLLVGEAGQGRAHEARAADPEPQHPGPAQEQPGPVEAVLPCARRPLPAGLHCERLAFRHGGCPGQVGPEGHTGLHRAGCRDHRRNWWHWTFVHSLPLAGELVVESVRPLEVHSGQDCLPEAPRRQRVLLQAVRDPRRSGSHRRPRGALGGPGAPRGRRQEAVGARDLSRDFNGRPR